MKYQVAKIVATSTLAIVMVLGVANGVAAQGRGHGGGGGSGSGMGPPSGMGVERGLGRSADTSNGRADTGRDNASIRSNGRSDAGLDRGLGRSADTSNGRADTGRDNASIRSNGRSDAGLDRARTASENLSDANNDLARHPGLATVVHTNANNLRSQYQAALINNPNLKFGQFVAAIRLAQNLGSRHPNITRNAILAGLASGRSIGQTLQNLGLNSAEAKAAKKETEKEIEQARK